MNSTGMPGRSARTRSATSFPSMYGITTSVRSRSIGPSCSATISIASGPEPAVSTVCPFRVRIRLVTSRSASSSSTTRIVSPPCLNPGAAETTTGIGVSADAGRSALIVVPIPASE